MSDFDTFMIAMKRHSTTGTWDPKDMVGARFTFELSRRNDHIDTFPKRMEEMMGKVIELGLEAEARKKANG